MAGLRRALSLLRERPLLCLAEGLQLQGTPLGKHVSLLPNLLTWHQSRGVKRDANQVQALEMIIIMLRSHLFQNQHMIEFRS